MYELAEQSSDRGGVAVLWAAIHTAEGPTDEFPARPDLDAGSARDLLAFFREKTDRSCHAIADDDELLDHLVPYDRAAWTLRGGNVRSDNLEMCALASWSRAEWLAHPGMLRNAARWVAARCRARGNPPEYIGAAGVRDRRRGYIDHNDYTQATGDGTHWDVGPNFPWDVFEPMVRAAYDGDPLTSPEDDTMALIFADRDDFKRAVREVLNEGTGAGQTSWAATSRATLQTVQSVVNLVNSSTGTLAARITESRSAVLAAIAALPTAGLDDAERAELAEAIAGLLAEHGITVDVPAVAAALAADLTGRLAA